MQCLFKLCNVKLGMRGHGNHQWLVVHENNDEGEANGKEMKGLL